MSQQLNKAPQAEQTKLCEECDTELKPEEVEDGICGDCAEDEDLNECFSCGADLDTEDHDDDCPESDEWEDDDDWDSDLDEDFEF